MRIIILITLMFFVSNTLLAQDMKKFNLYKPDENATEELNKAIQLAKQTGKHVFVQIGGNWCVWCARFYEFCKQDKQIDSSIKSGYITYHLNYSTENRNKEIMAKLGFPQRFGFPVFIILDANGTRIRTQYSAYLENDKSYSKEKVLEFLDTWNASALDPKKYVNF